MKCKAVITALAVSAVFATSANAAWIPGTAYRVTEDDANTLLERAVDSAYCSGIPRFGHNGEFPDEEFRVFDCTLKRNEIYCTDWRMRAIKANRVGYFRLVTVKKGDCY